MAIFKFTEARIRDLALGSGIHRDTDVKGLLCICHKTTKTFACQGDVRRDKRLVRTVRVSKTRPPGGAFGSRPTSGGRWPISRSCRAWPK